ncbi:hypothetical protein [Bacillus altitudinis]|uniref:hypothetical protein n=1 Tax=Bacillus altitudinis TaxID=293387 RepID=UPI00119DFD44|nr:hypothetical protein [Bacillus altitudinis]
MSKISGVIMDVMGVEMVRKGCDWGSNLGRNKGSCFGKRGRMKGKIIVRRMGMVKMMDVKGRRMKEGFW